MGMKGFHGRIDSFQPTTWFGHLIVAEVIWFMVDRLPVWAAFSLLAVAVAVFAWREYRDVTAHRDAGHPMNVWIADSIGDMVGPLTVFWAAVGDPWVAHTVGLYILGLGTVAWVGLGDPGGKDA